MCCAGVYAGDEKEIFLAHRVVLAARSPVFRAMFFSKFAEASDKEAIPLPDVTPQIFATMLWFESACCSCCCNRIESLSIAGACTQTRCGRT